MSKLRCHYCGKQIDWPPLDYAADPPWRQFGVAEAEFAARVRMSHDACVIDNENYVLRGNIDIPIVGSDATFSWGAWCSVSKASYQRLCQVWEARARETEPPVFAWLLSSLPGYEVPTAPVKARIHLRKHGIAILIVVDPEHPLGREQIEGISEDRVWEFAREILGTNAEPRCAHH